MIIPALSLILLIFLIYLCVHRNPHDRIETFVDGVDISVEDLNDDTDEPTAIVDLDKTPTEQIIIDIDGEETRVIDARFLEENIYEGFEKPKIGFPDGYFKIHNRLNGKCLDVNGGSSDGRSARFLCRFLCKQLE